MRFFFFHKAEVEVVLCKDLNDNNFFTTFFSLPLLIELNVHHRSFLLNNFANKQFVLLSNKPFHLFII